MRGLSQGSLARNWVNKYAPETYRIRVLNELPDSIRASLTDIQRSKLGLLLQELEKVDVWNEDNIKEAMKRVPRESKDVEKTFFEATYLVFFGKPNGPRIALTWQCLVRILSLID